MIDALFYLKLVLSAYAGIDILTPERRLKIRMALFSEKVVLP
jgi:hypothetical protein